MKAILDSYRNSLRLLECRIEELRQQVKDTRLSPLEAQSLEARRRILCEEVHEIEQAIGCILPYVRTDAPEQAGDGSCV
ncbi:MAG: hypothetical protein ACI4XB_08615 [Ruminococcus sp.]